MANDRRTNLQKILEDLLGTRCVYYQPPSNTQMSYPCIRYTKKDISSTYANDKMYSKTTCYELIVIDRKPDNPVIEKLMELPYCSYDRNYKSDNLEHDVFTLYY